MKKLVKTPRVTVNPHPSTIVSCRDKDGRNNALAVGFIANVSFDPVMVMIGIVPARYSWHIVKETGCFVVNLPPKSFRKEFQYLGTVSGRDEDKFKALGLEWENGSVVDAPLLSACPVSIECTVTESIKPGSHELFVGKVEAVHVDERFIDRDGNILWSDMDLL